MTAPAPAQPNDRKFRILEAGSEIGGVRVIAVLTPFATRRAECRYLVQFLCCGKSEHITHQRLVARGSQSLKTCRTCSTRAIKAWMTGAYIVAQDRAK